MRPRRILVTGAAGFLGGAVTRRLAHRSEVERLVAVDVGEFDPPPGVVGARRDMAEGIGDLLREHRIESVVHHAYRIRPGHDQAADRRVNVDATARLASDAAGAGVRRIVYPSSTTVYGAWPGAGLHRETETPRPLPGFVYSAHKVEAEAALREAAASGGPEALILRCCVVVGPHCRGFIPDSLSMRLLPTAAGHDPQMQFIHVEDYVDAVDAALAADAPGRFNVAGAGTIRVSEMAELLGTRLLRFPPGMLRGLIGLSWRLRLQRRSPAAGLDLIVHPWLASTEAAAEGLGWRPAHSTREAVADWAESRRGVPVDLSPPEVGGTGTGPSPVL